MSDPQTYCIRITIPGGLPEHVKLIRERYFHLCSELHWPGHDYIPVEGELSNETTGGMIERTHIAAGQNADGERLTMPERQPAIPKHTIEGYMDALRAYANCEDDFSGRYIDSVTEAAQLIADAFLPKGWTADDEGGDHDQ